MEKLIDKEIKYLNKLNLNKKTKPKLAIIMSSVFLLYSLVNFYLLHEIITKFNYSLLNIFKLYFISPDITHLYSAMEITAMQKLSTGLMFIALSVFVYGFTAGEIFKENLLKKCYNELKKYQNKNE